MKTNMDRHILPSEILAPTSQNSKSDKTSQTVALIQTEPWVAVNDQNIGRTRCGSDPNRPYECLFWTKLKFWDTR
jgi:hypothetical protein